MEITFSSSFKKSFRKIAKGNPSLEDSFWKAVEVFINEPFHSTLRTHRLSGQLRNLWSFTVDFNTRVVFYFTNDKPKKAVSCFRHVFENQF
jgi:mRNA-degrading endonuclease YafQ of YafQ-DinJ toxin-antitoxin module